MKTIKSKPRTVGLTKSGSATKKTPQLSRKSTLPPWVIGSYDGPTDGKLSLKKGYTA